MHLTTVTSPPPLTHINGSLNGRATRSRSSIRPATLLMNLCLVGLVCLTAMAQTTLGQKRVECANIDHAKTFVNSLYLDIFGHKPDRIGSRTRTDQITMCGADAACVESERASVALGLFNSLNIADNGQFVSELYRRLLRREPDPGGHQAWLNVLNQTNDRKLVVNGFINDGEYRNRCFPSTQQLIFTGWGTPTPDDLVSGWQAMQQMSFLDGTAVYPKLDAGIASDVEYLRNALISPRQLDALDYTQMIQKIRTATDGWKANNTLTENFAWLRLTPLPGNYNSSTIEDFSWNDNPLWTQINKNAATMARVARDSGLKGLFLDPELYYPNLPVFSQNAYPGDGGVIFGRGKSFMEQMLNVYPDITIIGAFGHSFVEFNGTHVLPYNHFLNGMLAAIHERPGAKRLHDGMEVFVMGGTPTEPEDLYRHAMGLQGGNGQYWSGGGGWYYSWREMHERYELGAPGIWVDEDRHWDATNIANNYYSPAALSTQIKSALKATDHYVWLYGERANFFQTAASGSPNIPQEYRDAICRAKAEAEDSILPKCQTPFLGTPFSTSAVIQVEDFDNGGEGVAYHDGDPGNNGGAYRQTGVDINNDPPTINTGWVQSGEWLEYTLDVATAGTYHIEARGATRGNYGTFHFEVDGFNKTGAMMIPWTPEGIYAWQTINSPSFHLSSGRHVVRLAIDGAWGPSFDYFSLVPEP